MQRSEAFRVHDAIAVEARLLGLQVRLGKSQPKHAIDERLKLAIVGHGRRFAARQGAPADAVVHRYGLEVQHRG